MNTVLTRTSREWGMIIPEQPGIGNFVNFVSSSQSQLLQRILHLHRRRGQLRIPRRCALRFALYRHHESPGPPPAGRLPFCHLVYVLTPLLANSHPCTTKKINNPDCYFWLCECRESNWKNYATLTRDAVGHFVYHGACAPAPGERRRTTVRLLDLVLLTSLLRASLFSLISPARCI